MAVGLIILGIVALLIFFGLTERFFRKIGISAKLAFVLVLALSIGAIVPQFGFKNVFTVNLSGFILPVVFTILFCAIIGMNSDLVRAFLAMVAVAGVAVAVRMLMMPTTFGGVLTASVIVGLVGGVVAYLIGMSRLSTLVAAIGGIVLGDLIVNMVNRFILNGSVIALGSSGVFDAIIIAAVTGVMLVEAVTAIKRTANRKTVSRTNLNMEAGEDADLSGREMSTVNTELDDEEMTDYFED